MNINQSAARALDNPKPVNCPGCHYPVNPDAFQQLRPDGPWILAAGSCPTCEAARLRDAEITRRLAAEALYRAAVPANYRPVDQAGTTDVQHPDWKLHRGGLQLAHLRGWELSGKPWAAIVGAGGHLKSRVIGLHALDLAREGCPLLWLNGATLGWASDTRKDHTKRVLANESLQSYRKHKGVLILDDLWKGEFTPAYISALYALLEHRNAHRLPILWTANTHPEAIRTRLDADNRDPIVGRLLENTHLLEL